MNQNFWRSDITYGVKKDQNVKSHFWLLTFFSTKWFLIMFSTKWFSTFWSSKKYFRRSDFWRSDPLCKILEVLFACYFIIEIYVLEKLNWLIFRKWFIEKKNTFWHFFLLFWNLALWHFSGLSFWQF